MILVLLDFSIGILQGLSLKWRFADQQGVQDATNRPDVDLVTVTSLAENLGCDVIRSTAQRSLSLAIKFNVCGQSEVTDFDLQ